MRREEKRRDEKGNRREEQRKRKRREEKGRKGKGSNLSCLGFSSLEDSTSGPFVSTGRSSASSGNENPKVELTGKSCSRPLK